MAEFIIFNENEKFKMKFSLDSTISELKKVISQRLNLADLTKFNLFLEKRGFLDITPESLNSSLSSFKSSLLNSNPPYNIFCFSVSKIENIIQNNLFCPNHLIPDNNKEISQIGIKIKEKKK